ncbi:MAG TPA: hypothetical protein VGY98_20690 [Verrucomicrobiae bacterium]|nr:hypothetical protein [Verrucomicrobiae bacterium]
MKNEADAMGKKPEDISARIREVDAKMASLEDRIEKNRADLERNNASITLRIAELCKATMLKGNGSKR